MLYYIIYHTAAIAGYTAARDAREDYIEKRERLLSQTRLSPTPLWERARGVSQRLATTWPISQRRLKTAGRSLAFPTLSYILYIWYVCIYIYRYMYVDIMRKLPQRVNGCIFYPSSDTRMIWMMKISWD